MHSPAPLSLDSLQLRPKRFLPKPAAHKRKTTQLASFTLLSGSLHASSHPPESVAEVIEQEEATTTEVTTPTEASAAPESDPAAVQEQTSYGFGHRFGNQLSGFGLAAEDLNYDALLKGFQDALAGKEASHDQDSLRAAMKALQTKVQDRDKALGEANLAAGEKFLAENGQRDGVITTESGLQYEIITKGEGEVYEKPQSGPDRTQFMIKYHGTLVDGQVFDTTEDRTVPMGINTVPGFREALTSMPVGSNWKLYLKPDLGYGPNRRGSKIPPNSTLIFDLTLEEIKVPPPPKAPATAGKRPTAVSPPIRIPLPTKEGENTDGDKPAEKEEEPKSE